MWSAIISWDHTSFRHPQTLWYVLLYAPDPSHAFCHHVLLRQWQCLLFNYLIISYVHVIRLIKVTPQCFLSNSPPSHPPFLSPNVVCVSLCFQIYRIHLVCLCAHEYVTILWSVSSLSRTTSSQKTSSPPCSDHNLGLHEALPMHSLVSAGLI